MLARALRVQRIKHDEELRWTSSIRMPAISAFVPFVAPLQGSSFLFIDPPRAALVTSLALGYHVPGLQPDESTLSDVAMPLKWFSLRSCILGDYASPAKGVSGSRQTDDANFCIRVMNSCTFCGS